MRFSFVHIGGTSSNQAASLESQTIHPIQYVSGRTLREICEPVAASPIEKEMVFKLKVAGFDYLYVKPPSNPSTREWFEYLYRISKDDFSEENKTLLELLNRISKKDFETEAWILRRRLDKNRALSSGKIAEYWCYTTRFIPIVPSHSLGECGRTFVFFRTIWRKLNASHELGRTFVFLKIIARELIVALGEFVGTLDFSTTAARNLIALGYEDTLKKLQRAAATVPTEN